MLCRSKARSHDQTAVAIVGPPKLLFGREPLMEAARHIGIHEERSLRHMLDQDLLAIARTLDRTDLADQDHDPVGLRSGNGQLRVLTARARSEAHTSELQSLMRSSYAVLCLTKQNNAPPTTTTTPQTTT